MTPAELARRLYLDQCRPNDLSSYGERAAVAAMVPLIEALQGAHGAIAEYYRYRTGGETRGSYDGKPERDSLWKAQHDARAALTPQPEDVA